MNKADLVDTVAQELKISRAAAERSVNTVVEAIKRGVKKDKVVQLIGFGTFTIRNRKGRTGRNPQTGEELKIQPSRTVGFRAGKSFKSEI
ncbi:MAG: HU family DNA-binding protein [Planctomycetes bacterium]|nr:HU family DNA-binding protein [Planctomycetota bacterium]